MKKLASHKLRKQKNPRTALAENDSKEDGRFPLKSLRQAPAAQRRQRLSQPRLKPEKASPLKAKNQADAPKSKIGSKLASLAKATAEKSDHRTKDKGERELRDIESPKVGSISGEDGKDNELSAEDRRKMIQDNIRRNMECRIAQAGSTRSQASL